MCQSKSSSGSIIKTLKRGKITLELAIIQRLEERNTLTFLHVQETLIHFGAIFDAAIVFAMIASAASSVCCCFSSMDLVPEHLNWKILASKGSIQIWNFRMFTTTKIVSPPFGGYIFRSQPGNGTKNGWLLLIPSLHFFEPTLENILKLIPKYIKHIYWVDPKPSLCRPIHMYAENS